MTPETANKLQELSMITGKSESEVIRRRIDDIALIPKPDVASQEIIQQIIDVGRNINQIARNTNMGRPVTADLLNEVLKLQNDIMCIVKGL